MKNNAQSYSLVSTCTHTHIHGHIHERAHVCDIHMHQKKMEIKNSKVEEGLRI